MRCSYCDRLIEDGKEFRSTIHKNGADVELIFCSELHANYAQFSSEG